MNCSTCGKEFPVTDDFGSVCAVALHISVGDDNKRELVDNFFPYKPGVFNFCYGCILKAFGVPIPLPEKQEQQE